jgi:rhomboid family GlyGly-CTERM serine protease
VKDGVFSEPLTVAKRRLWPPGGVLALAALCALLAFAGEAGRQFARYERTGIEAGEYWRLLLGHTVHLGFGHLWPNVLALLILGVLFGDVLRQRDWAVVGLASATAIDVGLYLLDPGVEWYVGLSGVLHGFMAAGALALMLRGETLGALLALGLCGKLVYEHAFGPLPFTARSTGGPVIVAAHLYGAAGGFVAAAATRYFGSRGSRL